MRLGDFARDYYLRLYENAMHELTIATNIIKIVKDELTKKNLAQPIKTIIFKAGRLHAIIPESLTFNFDAIKESEQLLRNSKLLIEEIPIKVKCQSCGETIELAEPVFICPHCQNDDLEIINGHEMYVDNIEMEDE